jgi:hypothetical protein
VDDSGIEVRFPVGVSSQQRTCPGVLPIQAPVQCLSAKAKHALLGVQLSTGTTLFLNSDLILSLQLLRRVLSSETLRLLILLSDPEDGSSTFLRNIDKRQSDNTMSCLRR